MQLVNKPHKKMTDKFSSLYLLCLTVICCFIQVFAEICNDGTSCTGSTRCCDTGCCFDDSEDSDNRQYSYGYRLSIWNMWYFWFVVLFVLMSCFGGCGYYKQRQRVLRNQQGLGHGFLSVFQVPQRRQVSSRIVTLGPSGYTSPSGFGYTHSTGIGVNLAPPPYSEVMNNPQMFPANTKSGPPDQDVQSFYSDRRLQGDFNNQSRTETANQMPQPPPYSEISNQSSAATFTANHSSNQQSAPVNEGSVSP